MARDGASPPRRAPAGPVVSLDVERSRFRLQAASAWTQSAVLLNAGSGSGKTTLASQVARSFRQQGCAVTWLPTAHPAPPSTLPDGPGEGALGADTDPGSAELLVVDDLHLARDLDALLSYLADRLHRDSRVRLLLTCDAASPASAAARARFRDLEVIDSAELAFTQDEIAELLARSPRLDLAPSAVELHALTEGRPLHLRLTLYGLRLGVRQDTGGHQGAIEPWMPADNEDADLLDRLSIPERFGVALAADLLDCDQAKADADLRRLRDHGLVVAIAEGDAECYRLPSDLRRHCQARFREASAVEYRRCCRAAALHLANGRHLPDAFRLAVESQDWELVDRLACQRGLAIVGDFSEFATSRAQIPPAEFVGRPLLGLIVAIATATSGSSTPISFLIESTERWLAAADSRGNNTSLDYLVRAALSFEYSSLTAKQIDLARAEQLLAIMSRLTPAERQAAAGGLALIRELVLATCALQAGSQVRDELQALIQHSVSRNDSLLAARVSCHLALAHAVDGQCGLAAVALHRAADSHLVLSRADRLTLIDYQLAQAIVAANALDLEAADDITQRLIHDHPDVVQRDLFHALRLRVILLSGDRNKRYQALASLPDGRRSPGSLYPSLLATARAELAISVGALPWAAELLSDDRLDDAEVAALRAHLLQHSGDPRGALTESNRALALRQDSARIRAIVLSVTTLAFLDLGRAGDAADAAASLASLVSATEQRARLAAIPRSRRAEVAALVDLRCRVHSWLLDDDLPDPFGGLVRPPTLSNRERQVLLELAGEKTLAQIAHDSGRSVNTVKHQVAGLYRKLGVRSRSEATAIALSLWPSVVQRTAGESLPGGQPAHESPQKDHSADRPRAGRPPREGPPTAPG